MRRLELDDSYLEYAAPYEPVKGGKKHKGIGKGSVFMFIGALLAALVFLTPANETAPPPAEPTPTPEVIYVEPMPEPAPTPTPTAEPTPEPTPSPEVIPPPPVPPQPPEPTPEYVPEPQPEYVPEPEPVPEPRPEPSDEPTPEPRPVPDDEPTPEPEPTEEPTPEPEPTEEPTPEPEPEPTKDPHENPPGFELVPYISLEGSGGNMIAWVEMQMNPNELVGGSATATLYIYNEETGQFEPSGGPQATATYDGADDNTVYLEFIHEMSYPEGTDPTYRAKVVVDYTYPGETESYTYESGEFNIHTGSYASPDTSYGNNGMSYDADAEQVSFRIALDSSKIDPSQVQVEYQSLVQRTMNGEEEISSQWLDRDPTVTIENDAMIITYDLSGISHPEAPYEEAYDFSIYLTAPESSGMYWNSHCEISERVS